jgi:hypothetical protein
MATQPSANPKICSHSFSECSLNLVSLQCTVYAKRVFCLACLGARPEGWQLCHGGFGEMIEVGMVGQLANSSAISNL